MRLAEFEQNRNIISSSMPLILCLHRCVWCCEASNGLAELQTQFQDSETLFAAVITQLLYGPPYLFPFNLRTKILFLIYTRLHNKNTSAQNQAHAFAFPSLKTKMLVLLQIFGI